MCQTSCSRQRQARRSTRTARGFPRRPAPSANRKPKTRCVTARCHEANSGARCAPILYVTEKPQTCRKNH
jgi:hypothetical protein